jgi:AcrR family transcriptional regulator
MAISEDTQNRLLDAAGQVFAEKGFRGATVREILRRAEISNQAAVNYYFRDKEQLYKASLRHAFRCRLSQMPLPQWPAGTPGVVKLREFIGNVVTAMVDDRLMPWQMQLLVRELSQPTEAGEELVRDFIRPIYQVLWGILREVLPPDTPEVKLHLTAFSIVGQCFYFRVARHVIAFVAGPDEARGYNAPFLAEHVAQFSLAALGLADPRPEREEKS